MVPREEGGLRYLDVWDTAADWARFRTEQVEPALREVLGARGLPFDPSLAHFQELQPIDVWVGGALAAR